MAYINGKHDFAIQSIIATGGGGDTNILEAIFDGGATATDYGDFELPTATKLKANAFYKDSWCKGINIIAPNMTEIGEKCFNGCTQLLKVGLPDNLKTIKQDAFSGCQKLVTINLPNTLQTLGMLAFSNCYALQVETLPETLKTINYGAFSNCWALTSITFKGIPTSISNMAFSGCTNLTTIKVPWANGAISDAPWGATNAVITYNYTEDEG